MAGNFIPNVAGQRALANSPQMAAKLLAIAEQAAALAIHNAPVGDGEDPDAGQFRDSIHGAVGVRDDGHLAGRLLSTDPESVYKELGTASTPAFHTLRRSLEELGLHVVADEGL